MDNKKIGKLIADLRKKQGLTQEQLGEKVGVGFKAVSKWECGTTLPDITIINELSKILGISTDELLTGELNEEISSNKEDNKDKKKLSPKLIITISIISVIIVIITSVFIYNNNKTYTYNIVSEKDNEYYVSGQAYLKNNNFSMTINKITFTDDEFLNMIIQNYEYTISMENNLIFGYGNIEVIDNLINPISLKEFTKNINISFNLKSEISRQDITKSNVVLKFKFLDNDNNEIIKEINLILKLEK